MTPTPIEGSFYWTVHPTDRALPPHAREWLAHVEAGRIGNLAPASPEVIARRIKNERVLRGLGN